MTSPHTSIQCLLVFVNSLQTPSQSVIIYFSRLHIHLELIFMMFLHLKNFSITILLASSSQQFSNNRQSVRYTSFAKITGVSTSVERRLSELFKSTYKNFTRWFRLIKTSDNIFFSFSKHFHSSKIPFLDDNDLFSSCHDPGFWVKSTSCDLCLVFTI